MQVHIWSDVVCPWCYIGKRRFERALEGFVHRDQVTVHYRSFQLDPEAPATRTEPTVARLAAKYRVTEQQARSMMANVTQAAAAEGLDYQLERTLSGNTLDAHRLLQFAAGARVQGAVAERFFRAYFTEGRSLFDHSSLVALGAEAGLDAASAAEVLRTGAFTAEVVRDVEQAQALGVSGVPFTVVANRLGVAGAQAPEIFSRALQQAWTAAHG
jgi:predicted DsbA family dithiol-disulfide isomerase